MELTELEKRELFQVEGDSKIKILDELHMTARYTSDESNRKTVQGHELLHLTFRRILYGKYHCFTAGIRASVPFPPSVL